MKNPIHILVVEAVSIITSPTSSSPGGDGAQRARGNLGNRDGARSPGNPAGAIGGIPAGLFKRCGANPFHGFVALGCVIRGETRITILWRRVRARLMDLSIAHGIPLGNGS